MNIMTENQKEIFLNYLFPLKFLWSSKNIKWYVKPLLTPVMLIWTPTGGLLGILVFFTIILPVIWLMWYMQIIR